MMSVNSEWGWLCHQRTLLRVEVMQVRPPPCISGNAIYKISGQFMGVERHGGATANVKALWLFCRGSELMSNSLTSSLKMNIDLRVQLGERWLGTSYGWRRVMQIVIYYAPFYIDFETFFWPRMEREGQCAIAFTFYVDAVTNVKLLHGSVSLQILQPYISHKLFT